MREFVQDDVRQRAVQVAGNRATGDKSLAVGDGGDVFHGAGIEVGDDDLVVLAERIGHVEVALEELEALAGEQEPVFRPDVLGQRLPGEQAQGHLASGRLPMVVVPGVKGIDVGAHRRRLRERPVTSVAFHFRRRLLNDGDDAPVRRGGDSGGVASLEVRLVEGRKQPVLVVGLEIGVEIVAPVRRIAEAVEAAAVVAVGVGEGNLHRVPADLQRCRRQGQEEAVVEAVGFDIEFGVVHVAKERRRPRNRA